VLPTLKIVDSVMYGHSDENLHSILGISEKGGDPLKLGLTECEARTRLERDGPNRLPDRDAQDTLQIVWYVLREPVFLLLLVSGFLYFLIGEFFDAFVLTIFVVLSAAISVIQQKRADRVLQKLRDLSAPRATVIRDQSERRLSAHELVRGDLIVLREGDRVPADAVILEANELQLDESLLTGESMPVLKRVSQDSEIGRIFLGSLIVRGYGYAQVIATGSSTEFGKIGRSISGLTVRSDKLTRDIRRLVTIFTIGAIGVSLVVGFAHFQWSEAPIPAALAGISAAMGLIPEEFAVVLTAFMAMGAWRLTRYGVLTRQGRAIEVLGSATVLCVDKTGTLTLNEMQVGAISIDGHSVVLPLECDPISAASFLRKAMMGCNSGSSDPTEKAIETLFRHYSQSGLTVSPLSLVKTYGLRPNFFAMTNIWRVSPDQGSIAVMKGAPEVVLRCCDLSESEHDRIMKTVNQMAAAGQRVLAIAIGDISATELPLDQSALRLTFCGLLGFTDALRPSVPKAVERCLGAGIRVVMITGDYPETAIAIARQAGLLDTGADPSECLITGPQLDALSAQMLSERISRVLVFARINPIQKLRIVQTLQQSGEVVCMTGDGVNDAPALKAADIGVAMGVRGTDVAREAASLVLIKEDFGAIVEAVARGRQIFDNLRKAVGFIISIHIPIAGLAVIPVLLGLPQLFYPVHIAFMEMIIDPAGSFIYESEPADPAVMKRPPRPRREFIFPMHLMIKSLIQGILVLGVTLGAYFLLRTFELSENNVRGLLFVGLVSAGLAIVAINMDSPLGRQGDNRRLNPAFLVITTASLAILGLIFSIPVMRDIFNFGAPPLPWFLGALGLGVFNFGLLLASKNIFNRGKYAR
jgi:Ca2+-transporting ATPase